MDSTDRNFRGHQQARIAVHLAVPGAVWVEDVRLAILDDVLHLLVRSRLLFLPRGLRGLKLVEHLQHVGREAICEVGEHV